MGYYDFLDEAQALSPEDVEIIQNVNVIAVPGKGVRREDIYHAEGIPNVSPKADAFDSIHYVNGQGIFLNSSLGQARTNFKSRQLMQDHIHAAEIAHEGKHIQNMKRKENGYEAGGNYDKVGGNSRRAVDERSADVYGLNIYRRMSGSTPEHPDSYDRWIQADINAPEPHKAPTRRN